MTSSEKKVFPEKKVFIDIVPHDKNCGDTGLFAGMFGSNVIHPGSSGLLFPESKKDPKSKLKPKQPEQSNDKELTLEEQYIKDGILACDDSDAE